MSRIGTNPIILPSGVDVTITDELVAVKGPKGALEMPLHKSIKVEQEEGRLIVKRKRGNQEGRSMHGLMRSLVNNMVVGVTTGWSKNLEMIGVGYRAQGGGNVLTLNVGFSHPVKMEAPEGITFTVADNTKLSVAGIDKALVGQVAANIRNVKPPEVYKGKGIRYVGEYVKKKAGKAGKAAGGK
jgi:large subunit ribosomal protein L6